MIQRLAVAVALGAVPCVVWPSQTPFISAKRQAFHSLVPKLR